MPARAAMRRPERRAEMLARPVQSARSCRPAPSIEKRGNCDWPPAAAIIQMSCRAVLLDDLVAEILRRHCQRQIDAGADPGRTPYIAVAHEDPVGLQLHFRIGFQKMWGALPMRGGAAAVENAGFGQDVSAGADAGDADAALFQSRARRQASFRMSPPREPPQPPATIKVEIAPDGLMPRASISTPDELRTAPGVIAMVFIEGGLPAQRAAISNTEIGPAASSNWKSGKMSTPIMLAPMS